MESNSLKYPTTMNLTVLNRFCCFIMSKSINEVSKEPFDIILCFSKLEPSFYEVFQIVSILYQQSSYSQGHLLSCKTIE